MDRTGERGLNMGKEYRYRTTYDTHSGDEQTGEYDVTLVFGVIPAEPAVGIMSDGIEPLRVEVHNAMIGAPSFAVEELGERILEDEGFWDRAEADLFNVVDEEYRAGLDARDDARFDVDGWLDPGRTWTPPVVTRLVAGSAEPADASTDPAQQ